MNDYVKVRDKMSTNLAQLNMSDSFKAIDCQKLDDSIERRVNGQVDGLQI